MIREHAQMQKSNVWEEASKLKSKDIKGSSSEKVIIVVGPSSSGKTGFIKTFKSDLDSETKATNLMEYTFIKKAGIKKEIIHCYEIASKSLTDIIPTLLSKDNFSQVTLILCIDLSNPGEVIDQTNQWLSTLRTESDKFVQQKLVNRQEKYTEYLSSLREEYQQNQDKDIIHPMPIQTVIIGTKYDLFEKYDTQNRKWLSRALRFIAHQNNASLYFSSTKNGQVGAQLRNHLQQKIQDKKRLVNFQVDHTKPIYVNNGQDSVKAMSLPSSSTANIMDILKRQLRQLFPVEEQRKKEQIDFSKYQQTRIDNVILKRQKQIQKVAKTLQNAQNRGRLA